MLVTAPSSAEKKGRGFLHPYSTNAHNFAKQIWKRIWVLRCPRKETANLGHRRLASPFLFWKLDVLRSWPQCGPGQYFWEKLLG